MFAEHTKTAMFPAMRVEGERLARWREAAQRARERWPDLTLTQWARTALDDAAELELAEKDPLK